MTNKEAKEKLYMEWQKFLEDNIDYSGISEAYKTAFKALEQEPCEDAISRKQACDLALNNIDKSITPNDIMRMPPVIPKQSGWIPVSERLPEDGTYLVTLESFFGGEPRINMRSFAKDLNKVNDFDFPKHKCGWYDYDSEYGYWEDTGVIAWMPFPEPYTGESEEQG